MSDLNDLVDEVGRLTEVTTELIDTTNVSKQTLDEAVASASSDAAKAETAESKATPASVKAEAAQAGAEKARKDAEAIVYEGDSSLDPAPGNIPIADSNAKIHHGWLPDQSIPAPDFHLPLISDLRIEEGFGAADTISVDGVDYELPTSSASFGRSSAQDYLEKDGLLKSLENSTPGFEHDGYLHEGTSTNLMTNRTLENATLEVANAGLGAGYRWESGGGPDGKGRLVLHACISEEARSNYLWILEYPSLNTGEEYTCSIWFKPLNTQIDRVRFTSNCLDDGSNNFDKEQWGKPNKNGFYKIQKTGVVNLDSSSSFFCWPTIDNSSVPCNGDEYMEVSYAQVEPLPFATRGIHTDDVPATRNTSYLDFQISNNIKFPLTIALTITNFRGTGLFSDFLVSQNYVGETTNRWLRLLYDNTNKRFWLHLEGANLGQIGESIEPNGRVVLRCANGIASLWLNGNKVGEKTYKPIGNYEYDKINLGGNTTYANFRDLCIWHHPFSDEQISALGAAQ